MSFIEELKRRNVFRVGIAYVLMGWVLLQGADFVLDVAGAPDWVIRTLIVVVGIGLPIALFFAWAFEVTPEGIKREADVDRSASITPHTGRKLDRAIIVFLALAVVLLLGERFFTGPEPTGTELAENSATVQEAPQTEPQVPDAEGPPAKSVAVLPFADLSRNRDQEWFADGLAEEILNALARTPDLLVASRTTSFSYKGSNKGIREIAEEMGVAHVLEGSVRSSDDRIRVTAQLIRVEDGFHVWSENYDRAPQDMIAIQEDLALSIAEALETTMDPAELAAMARIGTRSVEAYQSYLRGVSSGASNLRTDIQILETLEHYEAATRADPQFARAYLRQAEWWKGQLSPSYVYSGATGLPVEELMARFTAAIDAAIEYADNEIDRRGYLAQKAEVELRLRDARQLYENYLEQRPNDVPAMLGYSNVSEWSANAAARQRAQDLLRETGKRDAEAAVFYLSGAYDEEDPAEVADYGLERLRDAPDHRGLLYQTHRALMWAGRAEEGATLLRRYELSYPGSALMQMRQACIEGRRDDAEAAFASLERGDDDQWRTQVWLGLKMLGDDEEASRVLAPIAQSSSPYQLASTLGYAIFDPAPYPELMRIIEREGILRPPPKELPYRCPAPDETSIAVLPFVNMSSDAEQEYFSDGISEEILNALAKVPDLKVAGRTSSFAFKGQNQDLRAIGEALGVNHILEGSVRKSGDRVRITAQLIKADDGFHLWSETFDRELTDVFAIQDEIAATILSELETQLMAGQVLEAEVVDLVSYDRFLRARQLMLGRDEPSIQQAAALLDEVRRSAPGYAPAHAQRAIAEMLLSNTIGSYGSIPVTEVIGTAQPLIDEALGLDSELPDAHAALGLLRFLERRFDEAEIALKRALTLSPNHVNANNWLHLAYGAQGRLREAHEQAIRVNRLDPLYVPAIGNVAFGYVVMGTPERVETLTERALPFLEGSSRDYVLGVRAFGLSQRGENARAIQMVEALPTATQAYAAPAAFFSYLGLSAYEPALPFAPNRAARMLALSRLGRVEEALQFGQRFVAIGEGIFDTIQVLAEHQRFEDIITFVESNLGSAQALAELRPNDGFGADELGHLVTAYRRVGRDEEAQVTLELFRASLDRQLDEGADNSGLSWSQAHLAMLEGDGDAALTHLERAVDLVSEAIEVGEPRPAPPLVLAHLGAGS